MLVSRLFYAALILVGVTFVVASLVKLQGRNVRDWAAGGQELALRLVKTT